MSRLQDIEELNIVRQVLIDSDNEKITRSFRDKFVEILKYIFIDENILISNPFRVIEKDKDSNKEPDYIQGEVIYGIMTLMIRIPLKKTIDQSDYDGFFQELEDMDQLQSDLDSFTSINDKKTKFEIIMKQAKHDLYEKKKEENDFISIFNKCKKSFNTKIFGLFIPLTNYKNDAKKRIRVIQIEDLFSKILINPGNFKIYLDSLEEEFGLKQGYIAQEFLMIPEIITTLWSPDKGVNLIGIELGKTITEKEDREFLLKVQYELIKYVQKHLSPISGAIFDDRYTDRDIDDQIQGILQAFYDPFKYHQEFKLYLIETKSGSGKSSFIARNVLDFCLYQPAIFITGAHLNNTSSILDCIKNIIDNSDVKKDPAKSHFEKLMSILHRLDYPLLVFLDSLNDHKDYKTMDTMIKTYLERIDKLNYPIYIIATCKTFYSHFFKKKNWKPRLWDRAFANLDDFNRDKYKLLENKYFKYYKIEGVGLNEDVRNKLANPFTLNLFSNVFSGINRAEKKAENLYYLQIFDKYFSTKMESIRESLALDSTKNDIDKVLPDHFKLLLYAISDGMKNKNANSLFKSEILRLIKDNKLPEKVYQILIADDIIYEALPDEPDTLVFFMYDEFRDYLLARKVIKDEGIQDGTAPNHEQVINILEKFSADLENFPFYLNIIEFITVLFRKKHNFDIWDKYERALYGKYDKLWVGICHAHVKIDDEELREVHYTKLRDIYFDSKDRQLRYTVIDTLASLIDKPFMTKDKYELPLNILLKLAECPKKEARYHLYKTIMKYKNYSDNANRFVYWANSYIHKIEEGNILIINFDDKAFDYLHNELIEKYPNCSLVKNKNEFNNEISYIRRDQYFLIIVDETDNRYNYDDIIRTLRQPDVLQESIKIILISNIRTSAPKDKLYDYFIPRPYRNIIDRIQEFCLPPYIDHSI